MNDDTRTLLYVIVAVLIGGAVWWTRPAQQELAEFDDAGTAFYSDFDDPLLAASLEVIEFDEETGSARPFKVEVRDGTWSIPSHYDYPADGEDRLANTAAAIIDLKKDIVQSDRLQDHQTLGVIDPLDQTSPSVVGRGNRVTLRDESTAVLADFIIGKPVEDKPGFRYVRLPDKKRTYAVKLDVDLSTRFADWIETNLLDVDSTAMTDIEVFDYAVNEQTGTVEPGMNLHLRHHEPSQWTLDELPPGEELDTAAVSRMTSGLAGITITGVRAKPASLSADLSTTSGIQLDAVTRLSLQSMGYFVSDDGQLLSNEGEVTLGTHDGVRYVLRFGEVLYGEGEAVSSGLSEPDPSTAEETGDDAAGGAPTGTENRYLFVTAMFDESLLPPRPTPPPTRPEPSNETDAVDEAAETDESDDTDEIDYEELATQYELAVEAWELTAEEGRERALELNRRFAPWYYVISGADFQDIRLDLDKLIKRDAASTPGAPSRGPAPGPPTGPPAGPPAGGIGSP